MSFVSNTSQYAIINTATSLKLCVAFGVNFQVKFPALPHQAPHHRHHRPDRAGLGPGLSQQTMP